MVCLQQSLLRTCGSASAVLLCVVARGSVAGSSCDDHAPKNFGGVVAEDGSQEESELCDTAVAPTENESNCCTAKATRTREMLLPSTRPNINGEAGQEQNFTCSQSLYEWALGYVRQITVQL